MAARRHPVKEFGRTAGTRTPFLRVKTGAPGQLEDSPMNLERAAGIEPASTVWKTVALPLSYAGLAEGCCHDQHALADTNRLATGAGSLTG